VPHMFAGSLPELCSVTFDIGALAVHLQGLLLESHLVGRTDGQLANVRRGHARHQEGTQ